MITTSAQTSPSLQIEKLHLFPTDDASFKGEGGGSAVILYDEQNGKRFKGMVMGSFLEDAPVGDFDFDINMRELTGPTVDSDESIFGQHTAGFDVRMKCFVPTAGVFKPYKSHFFRIIGFLRYAPGPDSTITDPNDEGTVDEIQAFSTELDGPPQSLLVTPIKFGYTTSTGNLNISYESVIAHKTQGLYTLF